MKKIHTQKIANLITLVYLCPPKIKSNVSMLIIDIRDGENIDKALKRYKRKFQNAGIMRQLRERREFVKPSVKRRDEILKAVYKEQVIREEEAQ